MRFMMLVKSKESSSAPPKALKEAIDKLGKEGKENGSMIESGGLGPTAMSSAVRISKGQLTRLDGPFAETREVVGGYAVFDFKSKEEAVAAAVKFMELHRIHWPEWEGETEVRQVFGAEDYTMESGCLNLRQEAAGKS